jgi:hypothetical protein
MRGDMEAIAWRRYRDLHLRVSAIEAWISSFGTVSSKPSSDTIVERISKAGKAVTAAVTIGRIAIVAALWLWTGLGIFWGYIKPWLLGLLHG